jgi:hypothetical protein
MTDKLWYAMLNGKQEGPFGEPLFRDLVARGQVRADTLVWSTPMPDWVKAGDVPNLIPVGLGAASPPLSSGPLMPPSSAPYAGPGRTSEWPGGEPGAPLVFTGGVWGLLGRSLLVMLCQVLVIPSPWANASFYRWFVANIQLPNHKPVRFEGKGGDIWYIFMLLAVFSLTGSVHVLVELVLLPLIVLLYVVIMRWFFANLAWEGRSASLKFAGGYWPLLGWLAFFWVSFISIIGWAWVFTAMTRWICRHIEGSNVQLSFVGGGWSVLWRSWVFALTCAFIIPIPWMLRWYVGWMISQFALSQRA